MKRDEKVNVDKEEQKKKILDEPTVSFFSVEFSSRR